MKKLLYIIVSMFCLGCYSAVAKEAFLFNQQGLVLVSPEQLAFDDEIVFLDCSNEKIIESVRFLIKRFYDIKPAKHIIEKRQQILMLSNINTFLDVDINAFEPKTNYNVANALINTKVENNITNNQMKLCETFSKSLDKKIYILMYPYSNTGKVRVDVVNFFDKNNIKNSSFVY